MSTSSERVRACELALENVFEMLRHDGSDKELDTLYERHLTVGGILQADAHTLVRAGLSETEAQLISGIPELTRYATRMEFGAKPKLDRLSRASDYLKTLYMGLAVERFYALCLDAGGKLIRCECLQEGTVDETAFFLDVLLKVVVTCGADCVVLSHNHPGGTFSASNADKTCTLNALRGLHPIGIPMLDHIIIAGDSVFSMRKENTLAANLWISQAPENKLLSSWLK